MRNLLRARQEIAGLKEGHDAVLLAGPCRTKGDFAPPGVLAIVTETPQTGLYLRRDLSGLLRDRIVVLTPAEALMELRPGRTGAGHLSDRK